MRPQGPRRQRRAPWLVGLLTGATALAALILFITNAGDITAFARQFSSAKAGPMLGALAIQALPYLIAATVWSIFLRRIGQPLSFAALAPLSLAKLFADQAIPSGGLSGAAFFLFALTQRGVSDQAAFRTFIFTTSCYFVAFLSAAAISLIALASADNAPAGLSTSVTVFAGVLFALALLAGLAALFTRSAPSAIEEISFFRNAREFLKSAARDIRRMPRLFLRLAGLLFITRIIDGLTVVLIAAAIGVPVSALTGFVAVAIASITATLGPVPMGMGTFEAGMIASLTVFGASLEDALTITLIYRGLTLWLPLAPGFVIMQREFLRKPDPAPPPESDRADG